MFGCIVISHLQPVVYSARSQSLEEFCRSCFNRMVPTPPSSPFSISGIQSGFIFLLSFGNILISSPFLHDWAKLLLNCCILCWHRWLVVLWICKSRQIPSWYRQCLVRSCTEPPTYFSTDSQPQRSSCSLFLSFSYASCGWVNFIQICNYPKWDFFVSMMLFHYEKNKNLQWIVIFNSLFWRRVTLEETQT